MSRWNCPNNCEDNSSWHDRGIHCGVPKEQHSPMGWHSNKKCLLFIFVLAGNWHVQQTVTRNRTTSNLLVRSGLWCWIGWTKMSTSWRGMDPTFQEDIPTEGWTEESRNKAWRNESWLANKLHQQRGTNIQFVCDNHQIFTFISDRMFPRFFSRHVVHSMGIRDWRKNSHIAQSRGRALTAEEQDVNHDLSSIRSKIERTFGNLLRKFDPKSSWRIWRKAGKIQREKNHFPFMGHGCARPRSKNSCHAQQRCKITEPSSPSHAL